MSTVHPEDFCQKCGAANTVWYAPHELFILVNDSQNGIICPACFYKMAEEKGISIIFKAEEV